MNQSELLDCIKQAVREIEPEAEIILFGSRARGDARFPPGRSANGLRLGFIDFAEWGSEPGKILTSPISVI